MILRLAAGFFHKVRGVFWQDGGTLAWGISMRFLFAVVLAVALVACGGGEPTIDTSSDDAFEQSMERISETLTEDEWRAFSQAIAAIGFREVDFTNPEADHGQAIMDKLHGMTAREVMAEARRQ